MRLLPDWSSDLAGDMLYDAKHIETSAHVQRLDVRITRKGPKNIDENENLGWTNENFVELEYAWIV